MDARTSTAPQSAVDIAIKIGVVVLTLITAIVHLSLLFPDPVFILNGLGYLTLLAALYLPMPRLERFADRVHLVRESPHERLLEGPQDQGARCAGPRDAKEGGGQHLRYFACEPQTLA